MINNPEKYQSGDLVTSVKAIDRDGYKDDQTIHYSIKGKYEEK